MVNEQDFRLNTYDPMHYGREAMQRNERRLMDELRNKKPELISTQAQSHVKLGWVGQILVKGAIAYQTTEPYEKDKDALDAVDKRLGERLASLFE